MAHSITRHLMYKSIEKWLASQPRTGKVLCISGRPPFMRLFAGAQITDAVYPKVDIHNLPYPEKTFDYVISDQVLEHVLDPWKAVEETRRVLKVGGCAIHTTCSFNPVHAAPEDYWRFMPDGLRVLCREFQKVEVGSWGSAEAIRFVTLKGRPEVDSDPEVLRLAEQNDPEWPFVVWVLAIR